MHGVVILLLVFLAVPAQAATRYISPSGSDSNTGADTGNTWKTWGHAIANTDCGDTLYALDGTYLIITNGSVRVTKSCTASTVYTIKAFNERQAFINGDGSDISVDVTNSSYVTIEGLRVRSADNSTGPEKGVVNAYSSDHITFRRMIVSNPNRYKNAGHLIQFYISSFGLVEENELYSFHRHGVFLGGNTHDTVVRRNYCNSRHYADISGGYVSGDTTQGDDCFVVYPGDNNLFENNIAESVNKGFAVEALGEAKGNVWYGNIKWRHV